jgi:hypothetical protein
MLTVSEESKIAEATMTANVIRGAEWLDELNPTWFLLIDTSQFDLMDSTKCICGQIFCEDALTSAVTDSDSYVSYYDNGYDFALAKYFDNEETAAIAHGFQALTNYSSTQVRYYKEEEVNLRKILDASFYMNPARQYEFLAYEWIRQINLRLENYMRGSNE